MVLGQAVPEGLAVLPPGPELATALADLDLARVPNDDIGDVLVAQSRQLAHDQARLFATMNEVVYRRPFAGPLEVRRGDTPELYGADEIRAALAWTRRAAESESDLAIALVQSLPQVQTALWQGHIDRAKARVFVTHLGDLPADQIDAVCAAVLPHAPRLTTGQIADRIKRLVLELDPAYYERRYRKAIRDRQAVAYLSTDGTAVISAIGLPADEAAAAWERLDALARAARHDGHPGNLDQVRADLVLGLLDGSLHGLDRDEILQALLERFAGHADPDTTGSAPTGSDTDTTGSDTGKDTGSGTTGSGVDNPGSGVSGPRAAGSRPAGPGATAAEGTGADEVTSGEPASGEAGPTEAVSSEAGHSEAQSGEPGSGEPGSGEPGSDEPGPDKPKSDEPGSDGSGPDEPGPDPGPSGPDPDGPGPRSGPGGPGPGPGLGGPDAGDSPAGSCDGDARATRDGARDSDTGNAADDGAAVTRPAAVTGPTSTPGPPTGTPGSPGTPGPVPGAPVSPAAVDAPGRTEQHDPRGPARGEGGWHEGRSARSTATTGTIGAGAGAGVGVEVRLPLSTALGLDDRAGELPGWGPIPADAARRIVARQRRAQWRWVVVDEHGHLLAEGITRHRPTPRDPTGPAGGVVELQIPEALLATLAATATAARYGRWAGVLTDIAAAHDRHRQQSEPWAGLDARPTARFPSAPLRRHTEVRDRTCVGPGCRTSARRCDQDHTIDHGHGGTTTRDDLAPLCRHDHMLKTEGRWRLTQPRPGRFVWTSPLGRRYSRYPEPILAPPVQQVHRDPEPWFDDPPRDTDGIAPDLRRRDRAPPHESVAPPDATASDDTAPDCDPRDDLPPF